MKQKGYVPTVQVTSEEFNHARAVFDLSEERGGVSALHEVAGAATLCAAWKSTCWARRPRSITSAAG